MDGMSAHFSPDTRSGILGSRRIASGKVRELPGEGARRAVVARLDGWHAGSRGMWPHHRAFDIPPHSTKHLRMPGNGPPKLTCTFRAGRSSGPTCLD